VSERHWQGSGGQYKLLWGGRPWTLDFDLAEPGLRCDMDHWCSSLLSLYGLAALGRFETEVFTPATLVNVERYRSRVQATFAAPGWGGLTVRAAWSPSCGGAGVDLEVQASASSVGQLYAVEMIVQSQWRRTDDFDPLEDMARSVQARDARSAALSYDGRESAASLRGLTTLRPLVAERPHVFVPPGGEGGFWYVEMVQPNDVSRQIRLEPRDPVLPLLERLAMQYALFGHDFEKGVVFRARLRACWFPALTCAPDAIALYQQFLNEPLPLGP
jgi:hypothetical protein